MRILQLSDIHFPARDEALPVDGLTPEDYLGRLAAALRDPAAELIVLSGDLALTSASDHAYARLQAVCEGVTTPVAVIPGNHDAGGDLSRFFPAPGEIQSRGPADCFTTVVAGQQLLFLDSSPGIVPAAALAWLADQLARPAARHYLFMHHPPLLAGAPHMDREFPLRNHAEVAPVLAGAAGAVTVFCGHYHCARDLFHDRVAVHITPSTLVQLDAEADELIVLSTPPAYRVIEIDGADYRTWIRLL